MRLEELQNKENNQKLAEQQTFIKFKTLEIQAREAYLVYFKTLSGKFNNEVLLNVINTLKLEIAEINTKIKEIIDSESQNYNLMDIYQLHIEKKWAEIKTLQELIIINNGKEKETNNQGTN